MVEGIQEYEFKNAIGSDSGSQLFRSMISFLSKLETRGNKDPDFITAINTVLIGTQARKAALPQNSYDETCLDDFINCLNNLLPQLPIEPFSKVITHPFQLRWNTGEVVDLRLITHVGNPIRFDMESPINHEQLGQELGMYYPNTKNYKSGLPSAFRVKEINTDSPVYAEVYSELLLSPKELEEFLVYCETKVSLWNAVMEKLELKYRFMYSLESRNSSDLEKM